MPTSSRFDSPSSLLTLSGLLRRTRRAFWICLGLGVAIHFSFTAIRGLEAEQKVAKPLTTQFVKRQPRLTKPLELKKRPQPKRRQVERTMVAVKARLDQQQRPGAFEPSQVLHELAHPQVSVGRVTALLAGVTQEHALAQMIEGKKETEGIVDLSLEMLDIHTLDTGRYRAMVVQDPRDKRDIKGYLHLASAYPAGSWNTRNRNLENELKVWVMILRALVDAMNKFTTIRTDFAGRLTFDSSELLKLPFIYNRIYWSCVLGESEAANLGRYLLAGGFLYAETVSSSGGSTAVPAQATIKQMFRDALETQKMAFGKEWVFEKLPNTHALYHCYFEFDGPPIGTDYSRQYLLVPYLEGATIGGRLLGIVSQKNYASPWVDWPYEHRDNTRQLQFGVNLVVFALTQEGSITRRLMESVQ